MEKPGQFEDALGSLLVGLFDAEGGASACGRHVFIYDGCATRYDQLETAAPYELDPVFSAGRRKSATA